MPVLELAFARQVASTDVNALYEQPARVSDLYINCRPNLPPLPPPRARFLTSAISHRSTGQATPTVFERRLTLNALWWLYAGRERTLEQREDPTELNGGTSSFLEESGGQFAGEHGDIARTRNTSDDIWNWFGILCIERYICMYIYICEVCIYRLYKKVMS